MKTALLLSILTIGLFSSCATAFKSGQTPDDVYYSPGKEAGSTTREDRDERDQYQNYVSSLDDRYLHMKVANRYRWNSLDDFDYWYDSRYDFYNSYSALNPYAYSSWNPNLGFSLGFSRYNYWGWNNPFYTIVVYANPHAVTYGSTSGSNISAYRNKSYNNTNSGYRDPKTGAFVPSSSSSNFGSLLKRVFSSNENTATYDRAARTFQPSSSSSNSNTRSSTPAPATTSSSAGGSSGGYGSTGSSSSSGRGGRGG